MKLYSTNNTSNIVTLREATLNSLPKDKGLYLPSHIPTLSKEFIHHLDQYSFPEIAFRVSKELVGDEIEEKDLERICYKAINFPAPVKALDPQINILELFHGPSLAFKDFGARFMAELMSHFIQEENELLTILVATSGDTGGAVAAGFHGVKNIEVIILYPSGKVSPLQEKQLTTWGDNIQAVEWEGTFDDCQAVVKKAFLDPDLKNKYNLSSANSINIARLIPQTFYYFEAIKQLGVENNIHVSVPSGNIGNISAASMARNMGLPIKSLIAAHNDNDTVFEYYQTGNYKSKTSVSTISNAMDVGDPSNFPRFKALNGSTWNHLKENTSAFSFSDSETKLAMKEIYNKYKYITEPHAAVGYLGLQQKEYAPNDLLLFLGTAHPAKFIDIVEEVLEINLEVPKALSSLSHKHKHATKLSSYEQFSDYMIKRI